MPSIDTARILIAATDGFEQSELTIPRDELRAKGATVHVATPSGEAIRGWDETDWGEEAPADLALADARMEEYDALVLPGGQINPDKLRTEEAAVTLVREFVSAGRTVAAICHGPWMLIEADVVRGRTLTSFPSIRTDMSNAGAVWVDREVAVDGGIVTSRKPDDLPAFVARIVEEIEAAAPGRAAA
jgi:protease I